MGWYPFSNFYKPKAKDLLYFDVTATTAQVKAGTKVIVPAKVGRKFHPKIAIMVATGAVTTSTAIRLVESTSGGIILGHVAADMGDGVWVGDTGGTPTTTKLDADLVISEGIVIKDVAANSLTVTTAIRVIVAGYYV